MCSLTFIIIIILIFIYYNIYYFILFLCWSVAHRQKANTHTTTGCVCHGQCTAAHCAIWLVLWVTKSASFIWDHAQSHNLCCKPMAISIQIHHRPWDAVENKHQGGWGWGPYHRYHKRCNRSVDRHKAHTARSSSVALIRRTMVIVHPLCVSFHLWYPIAIYIYNYECVLQTRYNTAVVCEIALCSVWSATEANSIQLRVFVALNVVVEVSPFIKDAPLFLVHRKPWLWLQRSNKQQGRACLSQPRTAHHKTHERNITFILYNIWSFI